MEKIMRSKLEIYLTLVTDGYKEAGFTDQDVANFGGLMKLQGYIHTLAALELMEAEHIETEIKAREAVSKFVVDCSRKNENNNIVYKKH